MTWLSTAGFVPPSVYIGLSLFVLLERRSGDVSAMLGKVRGRLVSRANSSVGIQSCPTPPRHLAVRPDATRPWYVRVLDSTSIPPSHPTNTWKTNFRTSNLLLSATPPHLSPPLTTQPCVDHFVAFTLPLVSFPPSH